MYYFVQTMYQEKMKTSITFSVKVNKQHGTKQENATFNSVSISLIAIWT